MQVEIRFKINCGESTCAESPGVFCRFFQYKVTGDMHCWIFGEPILNKNGDVYGYGMRCKSCLDSAVKSE